MSLLAYERFDVAVELKEGSKGLNCWLDFFSGLAITWRVLLQSPVLLILSVLLSALLSLPLDERGVGLWGILGIVESIILTGLQMRAVMMTWSDLTGEPRDPKKDLARITSAWWSSVFYGLLSGLGLLLLIAPGLWALYACSLALPFVCVQRLTAWASLDASRLLLKGNMKKAFAYLTPTAVVFGVLVLMAGLGMTIVIEFAIAIIENAKEMSGSLSAFSMVVLFVLNLWFKVAVIAQTTLLVRLFKELREEQTTQPAV